MTLSPPPPIVYEPILRRGLAEDLGRAGDLTTDSIVSPDAVAHAHVVARKPGTVAGIGIAARAFTLVDPAVNIEVRMADGTAVGPGTDLAEVAGPARALLTAERTALNVLGRLSGIATATRSMVDAVAHTSAAIACTRKTTPGLRALEKYAVRAGGGVNHRFGLDDAVLIKDNHLAVAGSVKEAVERVRSAVGHMIKVELEVDSLAQLEEGLAAGVDAVLLDNMAPSELATAVAVVDGRAVTEASGSVTPETVAAMAETGVDLISVGWITHSAPALDVALDFVTD